MIRHTLLALAVPTLLVVTGCSGADSAEASTTNDELGRAAVDLKDYALTAGIVAMEGAARDLYAHMKAGGARDIGEGVLLAGLKGEELGFTDADDKDETFGLTCSPASADQTFHADTCSLMAIVKSAGQKKDAEGFYTVTVTGKLAKAIASALPRTSPAGLVGSMTTGSGNISCKTIPGPTGSSCTLPVAGVLQTLDEAVRSSVGSDSPMTAADAKKLAVAFF